MLQGRYPIREEKSRSERCEDKKRMANCLRYAPRLGSPSFMYTYLSTSEYCMITFQIRQVRLCMRNYIVGELQSQPHAPTGPRHDKTLPIAFRAAIARYQPQKRSPPFRVPAEGAGKILFSFCEARSDRLRESVKSVCPQKSSQRYAFRSKSIQNAIDRRLLLRTNRANEGKERRSTEYTLGCSSVSGIELPASRNLTDYSAILLSAASKAVTRPR